MTDFSHLNAIQERLFRAEQRLANCKAKDKAWHAHEVKMIKREEASEYEFLGITPAAPMSLDEIFAELDL